jgi:hypothetical protein
LPFPLRNFPLSFGHGLQTEANILTMDAIASDGWSAVALPIPVDASNELLREIYLGTHHYIQVYIDGVRGDYGPLSETTYRDYDEKLALARERAAELEERFCGMPPAPLRRFSFLSLNS